MPVAAQVRIVDYFRREGPNQKRQGTEAVRHAAFRVTDESEQRARRAHWLDADTHRTPPIDRECFGEIYFRARSGILFENAADRPDFTRDAPLERLGQKLMLPERYEVRGRTEDSMRNAIY
ncbi:VOC family protein [uncultured Jannaschia sp.]|uniref:VOC family protein n=1 Tax=uncultured Jannaschia sp. TaxID=293347 RepID=UPI002601EBC4|nr:VOC family protein [uncultured Jannaschia sp.]